MINNNNDDDDDDFQKPLGLFKPIVTTPFFSSTGNQLSLASIDFNFHFSNSQSPINSAEDVSFEWSRIRILSQTQAARNFALILGRENSYSTHDTINNVLFVLHDEE